MVCFNGIPGRAICDQHAAGASNGNLANDGTLIYPYDALNRLIPVNRVSDGLVIATYVYDAMDRRVRKTIFNGGLTGNIPNGTTDYIWRGSQVMGERSSSNAPIRQYIWGAYIDECIQLTTFIASRSQNLVPGSYYLLQDWLHRAVALTNSSGNNVETYDTDAYGNTLVFTAPGADGVWFTSDDLQSDYGANEVIYCGYRFDPETELYYVRARTYNPTLGRWIQRDPIGFAGGVNLYEYVGGRAVVGLDAMGRGGRVPPGFNQGGNSHPPNPRIRDGGACCLRWGEFWQEFGYRSYSQCVQQEHDMLSPFPSQPSDWIGLGLGLAGKTGAVTVVSIGLSVYEAFLWDTVEDQCSEQLCLEAGTYNCQGQCV